MVEFGVTRSDRLVAEALSPLDSRRAQLRLVAVGRAGDAKLSVVTEYGQGQINRLVSC